MGEKKRRKHIDIQTLAEKSLKYIQDYFPSEPSLDQMAEAFGCSANTFSNRFREYFGIPFGRFVVMLRMKRAAEDLAEGSLPIKKIGEKYGYADMSTFSKAFKKETGMSPRAYRKAGQAVPDMPLPDTINGHRLFLNYIRTRDLLVYGHPIRPVRGIKTDMLRECAYPLEHPDEHFNPDAVKTQLGFWWGDAPDVLYYIIGTVAYSEQSIPEDAIRFQFPGFDYAVFSVEKGEDPEDILKTQRMMVYYVMEIWKTINHKVASPMVYTYEAFDKNYTYLYLPLVEGMPEDREEYISGEIGIEHWLNYIDRNITRHITLNEIAAHFHYSEGHFRRIFKSYYDMAPGEYIRKRRLYQAAEELRHVTGERERQDIARKYHFPSPEVFQKHFIEEFHVDPKDYKDVSVKMVDLVQYYSKYRDQVKITFRNEPELTMIGTVIHGRDPGDEDNSDIPELTAYWMRNDPARLAGSGYECLQPGKENKVALWYSDKKMRYNEYILGPALTEINRGTGGRATDPLPEGFREVTLPAGRYAIFESIQDEDDKNMAEIYRLLLRCSFYGWIKKYRYRVDFDRTTYIRYLDRKLYFYIPVFD